MQCAGTGKGSDKEGDSGRAVVEVGEMRVSKCGLRQEERTYEKRPCFARVQLSDKLCPHLTFTST